jgi:hypothetical protein
MKVSPLALFAGFVREAKGGVEMSTARILMITALIFVLHITAAWAASVWSQPLTNFQAKEPVNYRSPYPSQASLGDIAFYDNYPPVSSLSAIEKLMVAGGTDPVTREPVQPWMMNTLMFCVAYYERHNQVPSTLSPAVISESSPWTEQEAAQQVFFKNPYTNDWPRCNTASPSAGDFFCHPLDDTQVRHIAKHDYILSLLLNGEAPDGGDTQPAKFTMRPWYLRVYGEGGRVIYAGVQYKWSTD